MRRGLHRIAAELGITARVKGFGSVFVLLFPHWRSKWLSGPNAQLSDHRYIDSIVA